MLARELMPGVTLRPFELNDADEMYALIEANRAYLTPWLPWASASTHDQTVDFIRRGLRQRTESNGIQSAITVNGAIAGNIGVHAIDWAHRSTSIGYWLAEGHQGRGVMTAAVRAYVNHAFSEWQLERVVLRAAVENARSRAVAERVGFVLEGVLRHAELVGDRWHDLATYSILSAEWPQT
jgi:ribosomal-protein-serine acetyltransferase